MRCMDCEESVELIKSDITAWRVAWRCLCAVTLVVLVALDLPYDF
jgi:hypothetical protein